jgi:ribosomal protein S18 acetylase RimI-like enzyme
MVCVRQATAADLIAMQQTNMWCLPENYNLKYYLYHLLSWPQLLQVAENHKGEIVGYVLSKMEDKEDNDPTPPHSHITSLAVLRTYRKCGLATKMMRQAHVKQQQCFDSHYCSLHVRYTNRAAHHLYAQTLGYTVREVEKGYYADGEDAYDMKLTFERKKKKKKVTKKAAVVDDAPTEVPELLVTSTATLSLEPSPTSSSGSR